MLKIFLYHNNTYTQHVATHPYRTHYSAPDIPINLRIVKFIQHKTPLIFITKLTYNIFIPPPQYLRPSFALPPLYLRSISTPYSEASEGGQCTYAC